MSYTVEQLLEELEAYKQRGYLRVVLLCPDCGLQSNIESAGVTGHEDVQVLTLLGSTVGGVYTKEIE